MCSADAGWLKCAVEVMKHRKAFAFGAAEFLSQGLCWSPVLRTDLSCRPAQCFFCVEFAVHVKAGLQEQESIQSMLA